MSERSLAAFIESVRVRVLVCVCVRWREGDTASKRHKPEAQRKGETLDERNKKKQLTKHKNKSFDNLLLFSCHVIFITTINVI